MRVSRRPSGSAAPYRRNWSWGAPVSRRKTGRSGVEDWRARWRVRESAVSERRYRSLRARRANRTPARPEIILSDSDLVLLPRLVGVGLPDRFIRIPRRVALLFRAARICLPARFRSIWILAWLATGPILTLTRILARILVGISILSHSTLLGGGRAHPSNPHARARRTPGGVRYDAMRRGLLHAIVVVLPLWAAFGDTPRGQTRSTPVAFDAPFRAFWDASSPD